MSEPTNMTAETVAQPVSLEPKPLPQVTGTETRRVRETSAPKYVLVDKSGRYRLWTDQYAEYGRQDFLDLKAAECISRRHFALKYEGGVLYIADLGSKNGTKVNGVDIRDSGWIPLKPGDVVEVADVIAFEVVENT
ncbi:MAG: FHA domain-containing protein [Thermoproteaceae archaeon]|nr:FHA domain-containing protein [Thermoproteaceae archaeon]